MPEHLPELTLRIPARETDLAGAAAARPDSPFVTPAYAEARRALGATPVVILGDGPAIVGFLSGRWFGRSLEVPSTPAVVPVTTWPALAAACRRLRIWTLRLTTFASPSHAAPPLPRGALKEREEHVVRLDQPLKLSSNHKRSIATAQKAGITLARRNDENAAQEHVRLQAASMARRAGRGEAVPQRGEDRECRAMLLSGAGEIFRAEQNGTVLSSILVLRSKTSGYYHSAGTSPGGMELGASPWLIAEVAKALAAEGCLTFNLGGATSDNAGLRRFKQGFGAQSVPLYAGRWIFAPPLLRFLAR